MEVSRSPSDVSTGTRDRPQSAKAFARIPKALFILDSDSLDVIYGPQDIRRLEELADFYAPAQTPESISAHPEVLACAEVIFSGWGAPTMNEAFLQAAPNLRAVFYGAGTIGYCTTEAFWEREIVITSAYAGNAQPVAEYTLAVTLLSLKNFWRLSAVARTGEGWGNHTRQVPGCFETTVALIGCGAIARRLITLLEPFDLRCIVYDPFLTQSEAAGLGVELRTLEEAFREGDVVSLHAPDKPSTRGMITGDHFSAMKEGATFINTARARIVREQEMIQVLRRRPDLTAIIDVLEGDPQPPAPDVPLLGLPNVVHTPHIAGSLGPECRRLGRYMVEEFRRYLGGEPLKWQVTKEIAARLA
jgi:phosphoglycerate dehydrogenase-like enzyme